jgi:hypothetical protein
MTLFSRTEIKNSLLGCLEVALFMPAGPKRFGNTRDEALRSFTIPALLFPASLLAFLLSGTPDEIGTTSNTLTILMSIRAILVWVLFFGTVAWVLRHVDHMKHFYRFVIASNWLSVPATIIFIPVLWAIHGGAYSWDELYPFIIFLIYYSYAFSAYMAVYALVIPWELAMFITMISMMINDGTLNLVSWIGGLFGA